MQRAVRLLIDAVHSAKEQDARLDLVLEVRLDHERRSVQSEVPLEVGELAEGVFVVHLDAWNAVVALGERVPAHLEQVEQLVVRTLVGVHLREEVAEDAVDQAAGGIGRAKARLVALVALDVLVAITEAAAPKDTYS